jgi:hypothetical protein
MARADKFLLCTLEACRPDQIDAVLEISNTKGLPLAELVAEIVRSMLDGWPGGDRQEVIERIYQSLRGGDCTYWICRAG